VFDFSIVEFLLRSAMLEHDLPTGNVPVYHTLVMHQN